MFSDSHKSMSDAPIKLSILVYKQQSRQSMPTQALEAIDKHKGNRFHIKQ